MRTAHLPTVRVVMVALDVNTRVGGYPHLREGLYIPNPLGIPIPKYTQQNIPTPLDLPVPGEGPGTRHTSPSLVNRPTLVKTLRSRYFVGGR